MEKMSAIGAFEGIDITNSKALVDLKLDKPTAKDRDLLVEVTAVSVNPVDFKVRQGLKKSETPCVLGWDAVGTVVEIGEQVTDFKLGDRVYYAGEFSRSGSNQAFQLVDDRLVALAPSNLSDAEAAAMPLTALTAYELLFEKMGFIPAENANQGKTLLIINGAGGVGSIAIQLAKWAGLTVIATASRPETLDQVKKMGADEIVNHWENYVDSIHQLGFEFVDGIAILHSTERHFGPAATLIAPLGHIGSIVETDDLLPLTNIKNKAASFDWEFMFAKAQYRVQMASQGEALARMATLFEQGKLVSTLSKTYDGITAENLRLAHADLECNATIGKIVLTGGFIK